jgi:uncharacterized RDD family membrane protein YckC
VTVLNPYAPPRAEVSDDPAAGPTELAGLGARLGACLLDALLLLCTVLPSLIGVAIGDASESLGDLPAAIGGMITLAAWAVLAVWSGVLLHQHGQTIGKRVLKIRVVRTGGRRASLPRLVLLRALTSGVLLALPYYGWLGFLLDSLLILGASRRCLHDRIAGTIVVKA